MYAHSFKRAIAFGLGFAILISAVSVRGSSIHITNPSFEANSTGGAAGPINGWTSSNLTGTTTSGGSGFDGTQVAFLTNNGTVSSLSQTISGLDTTKLYLMENYFSTTGGAFAATYAGVFTGSSGGSPGVYLRQFTPTASSGVLEFSNLNSSANSQLDGVSIRQVKPKEVFSALFNPSFEGSDSFAPGGYSNRILAWSTTGGTGIGSVWAPSFADNGTIPDGERVAFLKATPGSPATLARPLFALAAGSTYTLSFRFNASDGGGLLDPAAMTVSVGSLTLVNSATVQPVGGNLPYYTFESVFTAPVSPAITISNADFGPLGTSALLIDDITVTSGVPEPGGLAMAALGITVFLRRSRA